MKKIKLFFLLLLFTQFIISQVTPPEKAALLEFYNATNGPNWVSENDADLTNNWDFTGPVTNDWFGITVNGGHVTGLDLNLTNDVAGSNNLVGIIPNEIGDLQWLTILDLAIGELNGPIPLSITTLTDLRTLNLFSNDLTGTIPAALSNLTQLQILHLAQNELTGGIPLSLTTFTNLQWLTLRNNNLTGEIPIEITNLLTLTVLQLDGNQFTGYIYPEYGNLINLTIFGLEHNLLTGTIPTELGNLINIEDFRIGNQDLTGTLPVSLRNLVKAINIHIDHTNVSGEIPPEYSELISVELLLLSENNLTGSIPDSFSNLTSVKWLDLRNNQLSGAIPDIFSNLTQLEHLALDYNEFTDSIPNSISSLISLISFSASNNQLTGNIPPDITSLMNFRSFYLDNNQMEGPIPDFTVIPDFRTLVFSNNLYQFGDFENQFDQYRMNLPIFSDNPQGKVNNIEILNHNIGENITLTTTVSGTQNHYTWYKDGVLISGAPDSPSLILNNIQATDAGVYHAEITSDIVTDLTLVRNDITLNIGCTTPTADNLVDVSSCESYILPSLSEDNYFYTETNAGGMRLNTGDEITTSQILYVYTGISNCFDESSFSISISPLLCEETPESEDPCAIVFPNFFTPNNDGIHDNYVPITKACSPNGTLSIFNRYAKLVFQTNTIYKTWNGTFNGKLLPSSDYWYKFENAENKEVITGHFTLKR